MHVILLHSVRALIKLIRCASSYEQVTQDDIIDKFLAAIRDPDQMRFFSTFRQSQMFDVFVQSLRKAVGKDTSMQGATSGGSRGAQDEKGDMAMMLAIATAVRTDHSYDNVKTTVKARLLASTQAENEEVRQLALALTSNSPCKGRTIMQGFRDVAIRSYDANSCAAVMATLWSRMNDSGGRN